MRGMSRLKMRTLRKIGSSHLVSRGLETHAKDPRIKMIRMGRAVEKLRLEYPRYVAPIALSPVYLGCSL